MFLKKIIYCSFVLLCVPAQASQHGKKYDYDTAIDVKKFMQDYRQNKTTPDIGGGRTKKIDAEPIQDKKVKNNQNTEK